MNFNDYMKEQMELQFANILINDLIENKYSLIEDYRNKQDCYDDYAHSMGMINETLDKLAPIPSI